MKTELKTLPKFDVESLDGFVVASINQVSLELWAKGEGLSGDECSLCSIAERALEGYEFIGELISEKLERKLLMRKTQ